MNFCIAKSKVSTDGRRRIVQGTDRADTENESVFEMQRRLTYHLPAIAEINAKTFRSERHIT